MTGTGATGENRTPVTLSEQVAAGATASDVSYTVPADATIEKFQVRIYEGAELDLQVRPQVLEQGSAQPTPLVDIAGKSYIDGDDDLFTWELSRPVEEGAEIRMRSKNLDGTNPYDYRANLELNNVGGTDGTLSQLLGRFL